MEWLQLLSLLTVMLVPPSTKSEAQKRRGAKRTSTDIDIAGHIKVTACRAGFLGNPHNKQDLIKAVGESQHAAGIGVKQAVSGAGTLVVSTALRHAAAGHPAGVSGTDTRLLVMLVARAPSAGPPRWPCG